MKKCLALTAMFVNVATLLSADTNALIEVKIFKDWILGGEFNFGNFVIKNTGTDPLPLAKTATDFEGRQLMQRKSEAKSMRERQYKWIEQRGGGLFYLLPGETHVYEGRKFPIENPDPYSGELRFVIPIYFGNDVWIDTEPVTFNRVAPDSEEHLGIIHEYVSTMADGQRILSHPWNLVTVTYRDERWLYKKSIDTGNYFPICPLSLTNKIRVEPQDNKDLLKIWDGDKPMIYHIRQGLLLEGPDENNVFGKWTRERKQRAEADNAEVRRKKAEAQ